MSLTRKQSFAETVIPLLPKVSTPDGAASLVHCIIALAFISKVCDVRAGDHILVRTAAGGIGLWFPQLCNSAVVMIYRHDKHPGERERGAGARCGQRHPLPVRACDIRRG